MPKIADFIHDEILKLASGTDALIIGVSGPQGSGKSTVAAAVQTILADRCVVIGLDDFYLSKEDRLTLSRQESPLFEVRGPPGTHDVLYLRETIDRLMDLSHSDVVRVPAFSKIYDDREPIENWRAITTKPEIIILEGWCVGAQDIPDYSALAPLNEVEQSDTDGAWLSYQSTQLRTLYSQLWNKIDAFIHLEAPSVETVLKWRTEQEASNLGIQLEDLSNEARGWVRGFLQYYERITRAMADGCRCPGTVLKLAEDRSLISVSE